MSCANPILHGSTSGGSEVILLKKKGKEKRIARIPQGSTAIPDRDIVGLPPKSSGYRGKGAMMMTNLRC